MRGFGNLMIVDHGENYLSIYANTEALLKQVSDVVIAGEALATTGSSAGREETGSYSELRHLGRALHPSRRSKWKKAPPPHTTAPRHRTSPCRPRPSRS